MSEVPDRGDTAAKRPRRPRTWSLATAGLSLAIIAALFWRPSGRPGEPYVPPVTSFDGGSDGLSQTVLVPTLDTPIPVGKSAVWCASFEVAWKRFVSDVVHGPARVENAGEVADRLNRSSVSEADLTPGSFYAAAGLVKDGIVGKIRKDMAGRFPGDPPPAIPAPSDAAVAFAHLRSSIRFTTPFFKSRESFVFTDPAGATTEVTSFGIRRCDSGGFSLLRQQVGVLFCEDARDDGGRVERFALDLSQDSSPGQIVVARMGRSGTLADALAELRRMIAGSPPGDQRRRFGINDTLLVPDLNWRIDHRFRELEGADKTLVDSPMPGLYLSTARQVVQFRLDRGGAELSSEATIEYKSSPRDFHLDRPFLIVMSRRGATNPYFVMWVDNAELLSGRHARKGERGVDRTR